MEVLVHAPPPESPLEAAPDASSRALLAGALHVGSEDGVEMSAGRVQSALDALQEQYLARRQREIRVQMVEAQRRGDDSMLLKLAQEKLRLDRERVR
jgi:DNA primase